MKSKGLPLDPEKHRAMVLTLEAIATMLALAGAPPEECIEGASRLFSAAHREATAYELEWALSGGFDDEGD